MAEMGYSIGDGIVTLGLAVGIVGSLYVTHRTRLRRIEIIHEERMAAMEKGIPLPEFPLEPTRERGGPDPTVIPILGLVLSTLSVGAMIVLYLNTAGPSRSFWIAPLPFTFLGIGFLAFHFFNGEARR
jgi:hypothetical protein